MQEVATSGDVLQLDDASGGNRILKLTADGNHTTFIVPYGDKGMYVPGLNVTTIGGGECDVFLVTS
jgi:hypothetical protein